MGMRVLVVFAHPDDAEYGCAGTIARWVQEQGATVRYISVTSGERSTRVPATYPPQLVASVRESHSREAARIVGVDEVVFLRQPDGRLTCDQGLISLIRQQADSFRPGLVLSHDPDRPSAHSDHRAVAGAVRGAIDSLRPQLWAFRPDNPDTETDISDYIRTKIHALSVHSLTVLPYMKRCVIMCCREIGRRIGARFGEEFRILGS